MPPKLMDTATIWLPALGTMLLGGFAVGAWYGGNKIHALWYGFFGTVFLLLLVVLQIQSALNSSERRDRLPDDPDVVTQRAYISVVDAEISALDDSVPPTVQVVIKNTGRSPAHSLTWRAIFAARELPLDVDVPLDRTIRAATYDLGAGNTLFYKWTFTEWAEGWNEKINKGEAVILAIGEISYKDSFGFNRVTKYRLIHGGNNATTPGKFTIDLTGNKSN